jgi:hypothetical protein
MNTYSTFPARSDWGAFLATLILAMPSTTAFLCALALVRDVPWIPFSGLWLIYEVSRYVAYLGIVICGGIVVGEATQHRTSRKFVVLMGISVAGATRQPARVAFSPTWIMRFREPRPIEKFHCWASIAGYPPSKFHHPQCSLTRSVNPLVAPRRDPRNTVCQRVSGLHGFAPLASTPQVSHSCSFTLWNESRHASFHHLIQPLSGLNSIDFVERVFGKGRNVEILSRTGRTFGRGKQSRSALHRPSQ